jgi:restriction endonuclease Mrr
MVERGWERRRGVAETTAPTVAALSKLAVEVIRSAGGQASTSRIREGVEASGGFSPEQREMRRPKGSGTEIAYRLRWALVDLRRRGVIERTAPRTWKLTGG